MDYQKFLQKKHFYVKTTGFEPKELNPMLSEEFYGVAYAVLQGEMSIVTQRNGRLDLSIDSIPALCQELMDIYETYKDNNNIMSEFYDKIKNAALKG